MAERKYEIESAKTSEYEERRKRVLQENQNMLKQLFADIPGPAPQPVKRRSVTRRRSHRFDSLDGDPPITRSRRAALETSPARTRSSTHSNKDENNNSVGAKRKFEFRLSAVLGLSKDEVDLDDQSPKKRKRSAHVVRTKRVIKSAAEITDADLERVAESVRWKKYDNVNGSTCHQCRQKTNDMKTICHNENCHGLTGQFCGPCLRNRYGEDVKEALKDDTWVCPPCRGICNCSICRHRSKKCATGILIHLARESGYTNVKDYLGSLVTA